MDEIISNRLYARKTDKDYKVWCVGRVELLPDKISIVVYTTTNDGKSKACKEELFAKSYQIVDS